MKFRLWEIISFVVLVVLAIGFGLLRSVWGGFTYFSVATVFAFIILFMTSRVLYLSELKKEYDENLRLYFSELLNNGLITREQYYNQDERIVKGYYKPYKRTQRAQISFVVILSLALVGIIVALFIF